MKIDAAYFGPPSGAAEAARAARKAGMAGMWVPETGHDPFLSCLLASQAEPELELATGIAVGFARSPMTLAQTAYDLALLTRGKFLLGLGSQVKAHIVRRFSMPWGKPVEQMRELLQVLRHIWNAFEGKEKLNFDGEYYKLNLLTPFFTPAAHEWGVIPLGVAAVGPKMTELCGELADFISLHAFTNLEYLRTVTLPNIQAGLEKAGRPADALCKVGSLFAITGSAAGQKKMEKMVREQISFYASTPAYKPVLEAIGHGELHDRLYEMSRAGQWGEMPALIPADVLDALSLRAGPDELMPAIRERFAGIYDRCVLYVPPEALQA